MKTLIATAALAATIATPFGAMAHGPEAPRPDTIILKLRKADKVIIVTRPGQQGLRGLADVDLNGLVRRLDSALKPAENQIILAGKDTVLHKRVTTSRGNQATKRVYAISFSSKQGIVVQERDENLVLNRIKKAYRDIYGPDWKQEIERQMGPTWEQQVLDDLDAALAAEGGGADWKKEMEAHLGPNWENTMRQDVKNALMDSDSLEGKNAFGDTAPQGTKRARKVKAYSTFTTAFGLTNYLQTNGAGFPQGALEDYTLRPWGSRYFSLGWRWGRRLGNSRTFFNYGFDFAWNNFMLQDAFRFSKNAGTDRLALIDYRQGGPGGAGNLTVDKSKLVLSTLKVPLGLDFGLGKGWHLEAGGFVGLRIDSYTKFKFSQDGNTRKDRVRSNYYLNELQYGGRLALRRNGWGAFGEVHANPLFTDKGPGLRAFQFGVFFAGI